MATLHPFSNNAKNDRRKRLSSFHTQGGNPMAQDLEARVKALEGAVQNLSDQECASHAGALRSESHAADREWAKPCFAEERREHGSRSPESNSSNP
jgi:hypothetical protein